MSAAHSRPGPRWSDLLEAQQGVLARGQALRSGLSEDAWQWRLDRGWWQAVLPGVVVAQSGRADELQLAWAALLYAGPGAALSGLTALRRDGFTLDAAAHDVAVPSPREVRAQPSPARRRQGIEGPVVVPHSVTGLDRLVHPTAEPRRVRPAVAVLHAAAWAPSDRAAETFVAAAVQQRLVLPEQARAELASLPRLPRRRLLSQVLDDVELGAHARGELDLLRLLRAAGLPAPDRLQQRSGAGRRYYLDAWWDRQRVAVEVDGAHHREVAHWEADLLRSNDVMTAGRGGAVVLRFALSHLRHDSGRVLAQLRAVLL